MTPRWLFLNHSKDVLTQADQAIGDGDHGIGMARGFEAVEKALSNREFASIRELLHTTGMALLTNIGGAAGAVFGTLFRGGSRQLGEQQHLSTGTLATLLQDGLEAVAARQGMEKTKEMVAAHGKAKTLGTRSLGFADPGAISVYQILNLMSEFVKQEGLAPDTNRPSDT
jgi:dihydroxyacetone kinase-like protein